MVCLQLKYFFSRSAGDLLPLVCLMKINILVIHLQNDSMVYRLIALTFFSLLCQNLTFCASLDHQEEAVNANSTLNFVPAFVFPVRLETRSIVPLFLHYLQFQCNVAHSGIACLGDKQLYDYITDIGEGSAGILR